MPRKQKKYHYIYKTTCQVTGKFYVGMHSTDDLEDGYLGSGKILGYSIGKHGRENHNKEIVEFVENREALKLREKEIVNEELLAHPLNINLKYGGEGGWLLDPKQQAICQRARASASGKIMGPINGASAFAGKRHSAETKQKMSGQNNSQFGTCWVTKDGKSSKIKKEILGEYLMNGFIKGRTMDRAATK